MNPNATPNLQDIATILVLATLAEALVEYLIRPLVKPWVEGTRPNAEETSDPTTRDLILRYVAAVVGIGLCLIYQADLLLMLGLTPPWPWVGYIITGFLVGRGANFVHDFARRWIHPTGTG